MNEELQAIVEEMVRAGESEENIALVIQNYEPTAATAQVTPPTATLEDNALAAIGGFNRGVGQVISAPLKLVGAGGNFLQSVVTGEDVDPNSGMFTQAGQAVENFFEKYNPRYENVNQTLQSVGEGLGQGVGMIATAGLGAAGRAAQIGEMAINAPTGLLGATGQALAKVGKTAISPTGFVGGSMTAVPEWEAAKEAGLSDEEAFQTLLKNYLVGQTEAIPIERLMVGLNRITGGKILETVKLMGQQGLTEGVQEGIQTYLTNEIAKDDYDPDRDPLFQVLESAKVGGIVGFILPGVMSIVHKAPADKRVKLERKLGELQANEAINEIGDTGDPALNAEIDAAAQIDPVDKQVLEEVKVAEAGIEEQKQVEAEEKLQEAIRESRNENQEISNFDFQGEEISEIKIPELEKEQGYLYRGVEGGDVLSAEIPFLSSSAGVAIDYTRPVAGRFKGSVTRSKEAKFARFKIKPDAKILDTRKNLDAINELYRIIGRKPVTEYEYKYLGGWKVWGVLDNLTKEQIQSLKSSGYDAIVLDESNRDTGVDPVDGSSYAILNKAALERSPIKPKSAENTETKPAEEAEIKPTETPEYKEAVARVERLQKAFSELSIEENADELLFELREARKSLQQIAGTPKNNKPKTPIQKQIEDVTGVTKPEKSVKMTPNEAVIAQIRIQDRGIKIGRDLTQEQVVSKIKEAAQEAKLSPKQVASLASRAEKVSLTPKSLEKFNDYVQKVVADADYAEKVTKANTLRKQIRKRAKNTTPKEKAAFKQFLQIKPEDSNIDEYIRVAEETTLGFKPLTDKNYKPLKLQTITDFTTSELDTQFAKAFPDHTATATADEKMAMLQEKKVAERRELENERLRKKLEENYTPEEVNAFMEILSNESEIDSEVQDVNKKEQIRQVFKELANNRKKSLPESIEDVSDKSNEVLSDLKNAELGELSADQLKLYIKIADKIIENEDFGGAEVLVPILKAQQQLKKLEAANFKILGVTDFETEFSANLPAVFRAITGLPEDAAKFQLYLGIKGLNDVATKSLDAAEDFVQKMNDLNVRLKKKYGSKRNGFTSESMFRQGIVNELTKHDPTIDPTEALQLNKDAVQATIDTHRKAKEDADANLFEKLYKPFRDAKSIDEVLQIMKQIDPAGREVLDFIIDYMKPYGQMTEDSNLLIYNKPTQLLNNYAGESVWRSVDVKTPDQSLEDDIKDLNAPGFYARAAKPKQDRSQLKFSRFIPEGKVLDFNLHHKVNRQIQRVYFKTQATPYLLQVREMIKGNRLKDILGTNLYQKVFDPNNGSYFRFENNLLLKASIPTGFDRSVRNVLQFLRKWGYNLRLGGVTQWVKQPMVLINTSVQAGVINTQKAISEVLANKEAYAKFIAGETVSKRGHQKSLWNIGDSYVASLDKGLKNDVTKKIQSTVGEYTDKVLENSVTGIGALLKSDAFAANPSYLAFYIKHLETIGQEYQGLERENELRNTPERQEARAVAKQYLDDLQVPSNPAEMTAKTQYDKDWKSQVAKSILFPFGGFSTGMKQRLVSDWRAAIRGNTKQRAYAIKDMSAAFAESAMFQLANQFVLGYLFHLIGEGYEMLLDLPDEDDEEKYKKWWQRTWTGMLFDNIPLILTDPGEGVLVDAINWVGYELYNLNKEEPLTFRQYANEVGLPIQTHYKKPSESALESIANVLGPIGAPVQVTIQNFNTLEEVSSDKLTDEQKRLAVILVMMQFANQVGVWPSDITGATRREFFEQKKINKAGNNTGHLRPLPRPQARPRPQPRPLPARKLN